MALKKKLLYPTPAFNMMGVGRPAEIPASNCQGELAVAGGAAVEFSVANAISVQKTMVATKNRRLNNMFVIIVIENAPGPVFSLKKCYL